MLRRLYAQIARRFRVMRLRPTWLLILLAAALASSALPAADWFPYPVERWPSMSDSARRDALQYYPLASAKQRWRLCASLPHRKDDYWRAVEWGLLNEAKRLGVQLDTIYAGGYDQLSQQIRQLKERCNDGQHDAIILGAIDELQLGDTLAGLASANLPVIDLVNGVHSPHIQAKSMVSFRDMGAAAARYVNALCARERKQYRIGWFPGPQGAAWVRTGDEGFRDTLQPECGRIVHVAHGDTGLRVQLDLITAALDSPAAIDLIVGTAVTAEAAAQLLRNLQRTDVRIIAYYLNASVYRNLRAGRILAAPTDSPVIQARIAVDLAVRVLEQQPYDKRIGPKIMLLDYLNVHNFYPDFALAPEDIAP
jgi:periplasmic protein TorT